MSITATLDFDPRRRAVVSDPLWYKDAVIYQLHVKAFFDSTDDGIGDFVGLIRKLDYLQDLGVTTLWVLPFYPSPLRDDGYDIADYRNVNPAYGSIRDFRLFVREAHRRGLRVITELVVNHTSDQHPWFQRARRAKPGSVWRDWYVWSDTDQKFRETRIIFIDTERSNWAWDPIAKAYYWHRFYSHQPDLNFDNPRVFHAVVDVMKFWLDFGVDGMRLDAVPYLIEREGTINENLPETHEVLKRLRRELENAYPDKMLLAEANQWPEDVLPYFGEGDECHMAFHFPLMPRIYMALANEDRYPITDIMRQTPEIPANCQWAIFLRNHDELTLEMVTDRERDYLWNFYAAEPRMRINLGIRRRLAPLMDNDRRRIELLNSLLFSMPGTPIIYYGDEIGMGDNVFLGDRDGVRTPMQWSPDRNAGFSRADPARLYLPPIMDPVYGYQSVNVEAQSRSSSSLLNWMKRMIAVRQTRRVFGRGTLRFLYPTNRKVLAYLRSLDDDIVLCIVNLSRAAQAVELDLSEFRGRTPVELLGRSVFPPIGDLPYLLTLQGHGFFWFQLEQGRSDGASWRVVEQPSLPEFVTLVMPHGWRDLLDRHNRPQLERDILPAFLPNQRWFAGKDRKVKATRVEGVAELPAPGGEWCFSTVEVVQDGREPQGYFLPLALSWAPEGSDQRTALLPVTLAEVRQFRREAVMYDATASEEFPLIVLAALAEGRRLPFGDSEVVFRRSDGFERAPRPEALTARRLGAEQSNSSALIENYAVLKLYRRIQRGPHPELEMARYLAKAGFAHTPPLLGDVELIAADGAPTALAVLFGFVRHQGDAWATTVDYLKRHLEDAMLMPAGGEALGNPHIFFMQRMDLLGMRTAQLHRTLAAAEDDVDFAPERLTRDDIAHWRSTLRSDAERVLEALQPQAADGDDIRLLGGARARLLAAVEAVLPHDVVGLKTRIHGDYHLGQVLSVQNDFQIIDFEGEPARSLEERRRKASPLRDVAGMLRSFDYAAASAVQQVAEIRPAARPQLEVLADSWRRQAAASFLAGYRREMAGSPVLPEDEATLQRLVDAFLLAKALYEVSYELANRPAWVAIPVRGVLEILERIGGYGQPSGS